MIDLPNDLSSGNWLDRVAKLLSSLIILLLLLLLLLFTVPPPPICIHTYGYADCAGATSDHSWARQMMRIEFVACRMMEVDDAMQPSASVQINNIL